ncbi:uncharacterized protein EKO05_0006060 [Ascochyta rabiei]|uniref:Uncharacterized protein n=1 Tax=Didymella rabiei TaxID=5454 RepID=A0A163IES9_DIDRA|nr:uncharacterized protein EKO05_0006060 [Ascochyta rabiei]KZM25730.1 hypothetical protein ST47_g3128 [Ascochyta rabiei]UPX15617.1 hypothetical protein EKO05_0006060 [Ascochyta rabiei]
MTQTQAITPEPRALNPLPTGTRALLRSGQEAVAYHIPITPPTDDTSQIKTTISLPRYSAWTSGLHFHATHTEFLRLVKGAIVVELNGTTKSFSALAGGEIDSSGRVVCEGLVVEVPRYARHNWGRLEHCLDIEEKSRKKHVRPEDWVEEVVVEEWTDPSDISKPLFFWNLNGIIMAPSDMVLSSRKRIARGILGDWWIDLQLLVVFFELDNWPILVNFRNLWPSEGTFAGASWINDCAETVTSFVLLFFAKALGVALGLRAVDQKRTPAALWETYRKSSRDVQRKPTTKPVSYS